ncbi:MAG: ExbD/TolR family protein [Phycisphaerae bacterium]
MLFRPPKPVGMTLNLAPMVDVMMCLIIFFLLASKLVDAQHRPLNLPYAQAALEVGRSELGPRVVINVRPMADDPLRAEYVVEAWDGRRITERTLAPAELAGYLQTRAKRAAAHHADLRCVIRADEAVAYGHVEVVLRGCGLAKIGKVVFSARAGQEPEEGV